MKEKCCASALKMPEKRISDSAALKSEITILETTGESITRTTGSTKSDLEFAYDAMGNRISKTVKPRTGGVPSLEDKWTTTYYSRDASGNVMAVYTKSTGAGSTKTYRDKLQLTEQDIYGSSRVGLRNSSLEIASVEYYASLATDNIHLIKNDLSAVVSASVSAAKAERVVGNINYELSNHLGNVLSVVSDRKFLYGTETTIIHEDFETGGQTLKGFTGIGGVTPVNNDGVIAFTTTHQNEGIRKVINTQAGKSYEIKFEFFTNSPNVTNIGAGVAVKDGSTDAVLNGNSMNQNVYYGYVFTATSATTAIVFFNGSTEGTSVSFGMDNLIVKEVSGYEPEILMSADYQAYGSVIEDRQFKGGSYRYGFQNQEVDNEIYEGAAAYKYRINDPRTGRFLSIDPLAHEFPWNSPYAFSENRVIDGVELEGLEFDKYINRDKLEHRLKRLTYDGIRIKQISGTCTVAAVVYLWIKQDPDGFSKTVMTLYEKGYATYGKYKIHPDRHLFDVNIVNNDNVYNGRGEDLSADWIILSSIQDTQNDCFDFDGVDDDESGAGNYRDDLKQYMKQILGYEKVFQQFYFTDADVDPDKVMTFLNEKSAEGYNIILEFETKMIKGQESSDGTHNAVYLGNFKMIEKEENGTKNKYYTFEVQSWGGKETIEVNSEQFKEYYEGCTYGKKTE